MTAPYRYRTLDGTPHRYGESYARERARQDAAELARKTGQTVELIDPDRGVFHVSPGTKRRAKWRKIAEISGSRLRMPRKPPPENEADQEGEGVSDEAVLIKRDGYYWRPESRGYTDSVAAAGIYDRSFAESVKANADGITIVSLDSIRNDLVIERERALSALYAIEEKLEAVGWQRPHGS